MSKRKHKVLGLLTGPMKIVIGAGLLAAAGAKGVPRAARPTATKGASPGRKAVPRVARAAQTQRKPDRQAERPPGKGQTAKPRTKQQRIRAELDRWTEEDARLSGMSLLPDPDAEQTQVAGTGGGGEPDDWDELGELLWQRVHGRRVWYLVFGVLPVLPVVLVLAAVCWAAEATWYFLERCLVTARKIAQGSSAGL